MKFSAILLSLCFGILAAAATDSRLADAAQNQDRVAIRSLLKQHADVNGFQPDGATALHWAAHFGDAETADLLLTAGANANAANRYGATPLVEASQIGNATVVEGLLKAGANPNIATTDYGDTALMNAARAGDLATLKLLLDHGASVNQKDTWQEETSLMRAAAEGHAVAVKLLIDRGADVNAVAHTLEIPRRARRAFLAERVTGGFTAVMFAARKGDIETMQTLLAAGAKMDVADRDNMTPLQIATMNGNFDVAALMVEKGAAVKDGSLWEAIEYRNATHTEGHADPVLHSKITAAAYIALLLDKGADPNAVYSKQRTSRGVNGTDLTPPPSTTPVQRAAQSADTEVLKMLFDKGGDPNGKNGATALISAMGAARVLNGKTLFRTAVQEDQIATINLCLDHGVDVNAANNTGNTALHTAAQAGNDELVKLLAQKGAKLDIKNKQGFTPLDLAMAKGGPGRAGGPPPEPHETTIALLRQLMNTSAPANGGGQ